MIELRVVVWPGWKEVLQFRTLRVAGVDENGTPHLDGRWNDWQDAPRVHYDSIAALEPTSKEK